ncbi:hypothetical protein [Halospina denitrificans]|nr:hypothetical protein [Halospina denitrificans]
MMRFVAALLALAAMVVVNGCTTVDQSMQRQTPPEKVQDDRPMASWNRLMRETLPVVRDALVNEPEPFYPRGFVLSRLGGVRGVHISPRAGDDHEDRLDLIFQSIRAMTQGDDIVAFVVYATGEGQLLDTRDRSQMVVAHMEHQSGRALLRRLSYSIEDGAVNFGPEDVDRTEVLIMGNRKERQ